jgi:adenine phosphoribosyltransferase
MDKYSSKFKEPYTKETVKNKLRSVIDFPKEGINFQDISNILMDPGSYRYVVNDIVNNIKNDNIDVVVGLDARGFLLGTMIADKLDVGFAMIRKKGKMPPPYIEQEYELEYGSNIITISSELIKEGMNVHIHDDLLATGGTCLATIKLIEQIGANVASISFIIELDELKGSEKLKDYKVYSFLNV